MRKEIIEQLRIKYSEPLQSNALAKLKTHTKRIVMMDSCTRTLSELFFFVTRDVSQEQYKGST